MATYLTIDNGNTSAKAAVWRDGRLDTPVMHGSLTVSDIKGLAARYGGRFDASAWCSVADNNPDLYMVVAELSGLMLTIDSFTPTPLDLSRYTTACTLGADRIAAMAGAHRLHPGCDLLVADCGTAVTYDVVSAQGEFLGGNIAPGVALRLEALYRFTSRLPRLTPADGEMEPWGRSTASAMQSGAFYGIIAELRYYRSRLSPQARTVLTGGAVPYLLPYLDFDVTYDPDLVLTGLNHILEYNETK